MNEIRGTQGANNLSDVASQRLGRAGSGRVASEALKGTRGGDDVGFSAQGRALSKLSSVADVRTELVNQISREVQDPDYDIDAKLESALGRMLDDVFGS